MRTIEGIPQVITGLAYYPHIKVPTPNYQKTANGYEINLAVSDDIFQKFKDAGFNTGIFEAGRRTYTEDAVVHFYQWEMNKKTGKPNEKPTLVDSDMAEINEKHPLNDVKIGNGSKVAVQWRAANYGPNKEYKRPILEAVQILELEEYSPSGSVTLAFESAETEI